MDATNAAPLGAAASTVKNIKEWIIHAASDVQQRAENFRHHSHGSVPSGHDFSADDIGMLPVLPSKQDRMLVLHAVLAAADQVEKERTELQVTRRSSATSTAVTTETPIMKAQREKYRQRLNSVLQEQLVPAAASALLLCDPMPKDDPPHKQSAKDGHAKPKDGHDHRRSQELELEQAMKQAKALHELCNVMAGASMLNPNLYLIQDPYECMVLLISNLVLHYGETHGGYDARVRHVIQRACTSMLVEWMERMLVEERTKPEGHHHYYDNGNAAHDDDDDDRIPQFSPYHPQLRDVLYEASATIEIYESHAEGKGEQDESPEDTDTDADADVDAADTAKAKDTDEDKDEDNDEDTDKDMEKQQDGQTVATASNPTNADEVAVADTKDDDNATDNQKEEENKDGKDDNDKQAEGAKQEEDAVDQTTPEVTDDETPPTEPEYPPQPTEPPPPPPTSDTSESEPTSSFPQSNDSNDDEEEEEENGFMVPMDPFAAPLPLETTMTMPPPVSTVDSLHAINTRQGMLSPTFSADDPNSTDQQSDSKSSQQLQPVKRPSLRLSRRDRRKLLRRLAARKFLAMEQTIAGKMAALLLSNFKPEETMKQKREQSISSMRSDNDATAAAAATATASSGGSSWQRESSSSINGLPTADSIGTDHNGSNTEQTMSDPVTIAPTATTVPSPNSTDEQTDDGVAQQSLNPTPEFSTDDAAQSKLPVPAAVNNATATTNLSGGANPAVHNFNQMKQTMAIVAKKQTEQMGLVLLKNKKKIIRGLQITGVGAVAGTVFALTGGLAAPAIAAWIAGFGFATGTTASAVVAVVTTSQVVATIFGLGGGGLAAYKMNKRTAGLREFRLRREQIDQTTHMEATDQILRRGIQASLPQLHTTICVSGWLEHLSDFQRPWGIQPTDPCINNPVFLLRRFFTVHDPSRISTFQDEMKKRQRAERRSFAWETVYCELQQQYGVNPQHLLPIEVPESQESIYTLTKPQQGMVSEVLEKIVLSKIYLNNLDMVEEKPSEGPAEICVIDEEMSITSSQKDMSVVTNGETEELSQVTGSVLDQDELSIATDDTGFDSCSNDGLAPVSSPTPTAASAAAPANASTNNLQASDFVWSDEKGTASLKKLEAQADEQDMQRQKGEWAEQKLLEAAAHQNMSSSTIELDEDDITADAANAAECVVWDWHTIMGGDLHTLTWESQVLSGLSHIVATMATEVTSQTTKQVLGATAVGAIFAAVAIPSALLTASQLIDDPYQIVILRADEAGAELAKCLLQSEERRPVSLIGYSFGARVIFTCLSELARHQDLWEYRQSLTPQELRKYKRENRHKLMNDDSQILDYIREPASIVQDVVVMGLPRAMDAQAIAKARYMAGGRFVNCYSRKDWLLSLMFLARAGTQTCGTHPIEGVPGIENCNVTDVVEAHAKYGDAVPKILKRVGPLC